MTPNELKTWSDRWLSVVGDEEQSFSPDTGWLAGARDRCRSNRLDLLQQLARCLAEVDPQNLACLTRLCLAAKLATTMRTFEPEKPEM